MSPRGEFRGIVTSESEQVYRVADVEIDLSGVCLKRGGIEQPLRERSFQVLRYLIEHRDRRVTKDELIENIWQGTAVTDDALVQCIADIRRALADDYQNPRFIKTFPRVGYRFISPVEHGSRNLFTTVTTEEVTSFEIEVREETPPQLPGGQISRHWRKLGVVTALSVLIAVALFFSFGKKQVVQPPGGIALPQIPGKHPLAVMYFDNQSGNSELDWLREGLADMFITNLSRQKSLNVLNRRHLHVLLERGGHPPERRIELETAMDVARKSRADLILLGSFAQFGERLRVAVQLYNAIDGQHLFTESLDVERIEQLPMQVDLASLKLAAHLGAAPTEKERRSVISETMTNNLEAYRYYSLAVEKVNAAHTSEAIELLKRAIALDPQFAMAYGRIGYAYGVMWSHPEEAAPYLEKAFRLSSRLTDSDRQLISAWYAIAKLDFSGAIRAYREVIAYDPLDVEAYWRLGRLLVGEGKYQDAIDVFQQGLAVDQEAKEICNSLGGLYSGLGKHDESIRMQQRYVELAPDEANSYDSLGMSLQWAGRYSEAIQAYNRALAIKPDFEVALVHSANTCVQMGRYREALILYRKYIQVAPSDHERGRGYDGLLITYIRKGELDQAEQAARRESYFFKNRSLGGPLLLALTRGDRSMAEQLNRQLTFTLPSRGGRETLRFTHYFNAHLALLKGHDQEALESFQAGLRCLPPIWNVDAYEDCLANAYLKLGRLDEAISEYQRILELNPNYPLVRYHLAEAYERKGQQDKARVEYEQFLQVWHDADADIPEVVIAKRRLGSS
jgi:tetratricopeptide (TPR) repeat protein/DNA-binding winged helix-turn-helix (wHTH) protein